MNRQQSLCNFFNTLLILVAGHYTVLFLSLTITNPILNSYTNFMQKHYLLVFVLDCITIVSIVLTYWKFIKTIEQKYWKKDDVAWVFNYQNSKLVFKFLRLLMLFLVIKISEYYLEFEDELNSANNHEFDRMVFASIATILCCVITLNIIYLIIVTWTYKKVCKFKSNTKKIFLNKARITSVYDNKIKAALLSWTWYDFNQVTNQFLNTVIENIHHCYAIKNKKHTLMNKKSNTPPNTIS